MALPLGSQRRRRPDAQPAGRPFGLAQTRKYIGSLQNQSENDQKTIAKRSSGALVSNEDRDNEDRDSQKSEISYKE